MAKYSQRWVKALHRGHLVLAVDTGDRALGNPPTLPPRHIATRQCACQYIEDILHYKPQGLLKIVKDFFDMPNFN